MKVTSRKIHKIKGNVIRSTILTGQVDMEKKIYLEKLNKYFENKSKLLETSGKNVKAYIKEDGEIIIEKFVL